MIIDAHAHACGEFADPMKLTETLDKPGGQFFVTEPKIHVGLLAFQIMIHKVEEIGFEISERPNVLFGRTVLLKKGGYSSLSSHQMWR